MSQMDNDNIPMNCAPPPSYEEVMQKEATGRSSDAVVPMAMAAYRGPSEIAVSDETDRLLRRPPPYGLPPPSNQDYVCGPPPRGPGSPPHVSVSINNDFNVAWAAARPERIVTRADRIERQSSVSDEVPMTRRDGDDRRRKRSDRNISKVMGLIIVCFFCIGALVTFGYTKGNKANNRDVCASANCPYNSYCTPSRDSSRGYVCKCYDGYEGTSCQRRRGDACQGVTCSYNGVCEPLYNGDYRCVCHSGYSGSACQYEDGISLQDLSKPCFGIDCGPNGYCDHPICSCYDGTFGIRCEYKVSNVSKTTTRIPTTPSLSKTSTLSPTPSRRHSDIDFSKLGLDGGFGAYCEKKEPCKAHGGGFCVALDNREYSCCNGSGCRRYEIGDDED